MGSDGANSKELILFAQVGVPFFAGGVGPALTPRRGRMNPSFFPIEMVNSSTGI